MSRLRAGAHVGLDVFARLGVERPDLPRPAGLVDSIDELAHPGIEPRRMHPDIVDFFERTSLLELLVRPRWMRGFRLASRALRRVLTHVGQLRMPLVPSRILTRIAALDDRIDGRPGARACLRSYAHDGGVMQAVAYATFRHGDTGYMSVAFPLPGCCLNGVLRLDPIGLDDGRLAVCLTSEPRPGRADDQVGVWLLLPGFRLRLPFSETMSLWAPSMACVPRDLDLDALPGMSIVSRHEQRLFGVPFGKYSYYFRRAPG